MSKDPWAGGVASLTIEDIVAPGFSTPWDARVIHDYLAKETLLPLLPEKVGRSAG
jgi:hypothetical protein